MKRKLGIMAGLLVCAVLAIMKPEPADACLRAGYWACRYGCENRVRQCLGPSGGGTGGVIVFTGGVQDVHDLICLSEYSDCIGNCGDLDICMV